MEQGRKPVETMEQTKKRLVEVIEEENNIIKRLDELKHPPISRTISLASNTSSKKSWFELSMEEEADENDVPIVLPNFANNNPNPEPQISECNKCKKRIIVRPAHGNATFAPVEENGDVHLCHKLPCLSKKCPFCGLNYHIIGVSKAVITRNDYTIWIDETGHAIPHNKNGVCKYELAKYITTSSHYNIKNIPQNQ